jgi:hypothetical protein
MHLFLIQYQVIANHHSLFYSPEILHCGKIIIWHDFIKAGIVQLKDICYEVKAGFLPNKP